MKTINVKAIKDTVYSDVVVESAKRMSDLLKEIPNTDKPVTEEQWALFVVKVIEIAMDITVDATVDHLIMQGSSHELDTGSKKQKKAGVLYS